MPAGIEAVVEDGFATLDFTDRALVGPSLEKLRLAGSKVTKQTRMGPRARYTMPEGDAIAAGLIDGATTMVDALSYGDTGNAKALQDVGNAAGEDWARPEAPTSKGNTYVGSTPASEVMAIKGPSTSVKGKKPSGAVIAPLHGSIKKYGDYSLPQPHEPGECGHPGDGSGRISDGVIDFVEPTTIHSKAPKRPPTVTSITMDGQPEAAPAPGPDAVWPTPMPTVPPVAPDAVTVPSPAGTPTSEWTNAEIEAYAKANNIDLGGATKKADMLAVIAAAS